MSKKFTLITFAVLLSIGLLTWLFILSTKSLPGEEAKHEGREHVPEGSTVTYNFNPPTGGDHYASWITKGFYEEPRHDGNLVHSLEHGYIIFWYDCERQLTFNNGQWTNFLSNLKSQLSIVAFAQNMPMTGGSEGSASAKLSEMPKAFSDGSCDSLKNQVKSYIEKDNHKLIGMPRIGLDKPLILAAWGKMLKLDAFEEIKIKEFISTFRDNGPEHTVEP